MSAQALEQLFILRDIGFGRRNGQRREVVGTQIDHHQLGFVGRKVVAWRLIGIEKAIVFVEHIAFGLRFRRTIIAQNATPTVGNKGIIGIEIACDDAGVGLVTILGFQRKRLVMARAFGAITAGIGVTIELDETLFARHFAQLFAIVEQETMDGCAPMFALSALL